MSSVLVTGALGNLGWKTIKILTEAETYGPILVCDIGQPSSEQATLIDGNDRVEWINCDCGNWHDLRWRGRILDVDAVIHFAAQNPFPEATWEEAAVSMDMTHHLATALLASERPQRFVYVSSNHVMGRYKESLFGNEGAAGSLTTALPAGVGTVWHSGLKEIDSTAYATVKLAGERCAQALARATNGRVTCASLRIGWCQPGENQPSTLSAAGSITIERKAGVGTDPSLAATNRWFQEMWLSNGDFARLIRASLDADAGSWSGGSVVVNGMSNNTGMVWSLDEGREFLGYCPEDDVYQTLQR